MAEQIDSKVPQIRFKGFDGDWEHKKIRELTETGFTNGVFNDPTKVGRGYRLINVKDMFSGSSIDVENLSLVDIDENEFKKNRVQYGDIFFTRSSLVKEGIACSNINLSVDQNITFDGHLIRMQPCKKITDAIFLSYAFKTRSSRRKLILGGKTTTMTTIGQSDIAVVEVALPEPTEQTQIGGYFRGLDRLIGLHQRKHDKLVTLKKAMLQKMFPQLGANTPEIRFKGFEGDWVKSELKNAAEITTGFPFKSTDFSESGVYLVVTNGNIQNELEFVDASVGNRINIQNSSVINQFILRVGDILVTMDGSVGRTAKVHETNQILAQRVGRLVAKSDSEFLYQALNTGAFLKEMTTIAHGGTIKHISLGEIGGYRFMVPSGLEEQREIGTYFRTLDTLISQHATQLQKLQQIKSACLEKMFV